MNKKIGLNIIMGLLALMMVVGMAYQFVPQMGRAQQSKGTPALKVNGETVTVEELEEQRRASPMVASMDKGVLGDDFKTLIVAQKARQVRLIQASKDIDVTRADVNAEVDKIREQQGLKANKDWTDALQRVGLTDATFRKQMRDQLAVNRKVEAVQKEAKPVTDAEVKQYYALHQDTFQDEAKIVGRQIVVKDEKVARSLLTQARQGADFAELAKQNNSKSDFAERGGALGALENGEPKPVSQVVLPSEVGAAAFALQEGGITDVIASGGKFYIIKVEKYIAGAVKPFEQAKADATKAVQEQKKNAAVQAWIDSVDKETQLEFIAPEWKIENPTVATVEGQQIPYSDVVAQIAQNQQVAQLLSQMPDQAENLINTVMKPQLVNQLVAQYAAVPIAQKLKLDLAGNRQEMLNSLLSYGGRDAEVSDAEVSEHYEKNIQQYQTPASAKVTEISFAKQNNALAFRQDWDGEDLSATAAKLGGTVSERGQLNSSDQNLQQTPELAAAIFQANDLRAVGEGSLSDVVKVGDRYLVAYVTDLQPANTQPLAEVRSEIRNQLLTEKRGQEGEAFIQKEMKNLKIENNLEKVLAAQAKRVAAAEPKEETTTPAPDGAKAPADDKAKTPETAPANP